ncbi:MAG: hypothetical protein HQL07_02555 [Nitrospirae bacterium]|nr:hypothetical protein [Magnetococcales bacterium]
MLNPKTRRIRSLAAFLSLGLCVLTSATASAASDAAAPAAAPAASAPAAAAPAAAAPAAAAPAAPAAAAPAAAAPAAAPVVVGSYDVSGVSAVDKSTYEGVAIITKKGEAYHVSYEDSEGKLVGVASLLGNSLGMAFADSSKPTICMLDVDGTTGWKGHCIEQGEDFINKENWKRR